MESSALSFNLETAASPHGVGGLLLHTLKQATQFAPLDHGRLDMKQVHALCQASLQGADQARDMVQHWLASGVDIEDVYFGRHHPSCPLDGAMVVR